MSLANHGCHVCGRGVALCVFSRQYGKDVLAGIIFNLEEACVVLYFIFFWSFSYDGEELHFCLGNIFESEHLA